MDRKQQHAALLQHAPLKSPGYHQKQGGGGGGTSSGGGAGGAGGAGHTAGAHHKDVPGVAREFRSLLRTTARLGEQSVPTIQRLSYLWTSAIRFGAMQPVLSRHLCLQLMRTAAAFDIELPVAVERRICGACHCFLVPGLNANTAVKHVRFEPPATQQAGKRTVWEVIDEMNRSNDPYAKRRVMGDQVRVQCAECGFVNIRPVGVRQSTAASTAEESDDDGEVEGKSTGIPAVVTPAKPKQVGGPRGSVTPLKTNPSATPLSTESRKKRQRRTLTDIMAESHTARNMMEQDFIPLGNPFTRPLSASKPYHK